MNKRQARIIGKIVNFVVFAGADDRDEREAYVILFTFVLFIGGLIIYVFFEDLFVALLGGLVIARGMLLLHQFYKFIVFTHEAIENKVQEWYRNLKE